MGPAVTVQVHLLNGLTYIIELAKSKGLIVTKVAPNGVAHLIGVSIHFFPLNIKLRKTDIIISICWTFTVSMHLQTYGITSKGCNLRCVNENSPGSNLYI